MRNIIYVRADDPSAALDALRGSPGSQLLAGGTDLIPLMKDDIAQASGLVDLGKWSAGSSVQFHEGDLVIGALTPLSTLEKEPGIVSRFPALAQACGLAATPQLRNMGTIGGNLLQQTRCWYYRGPYHCWLKGGEKCYARDGENELHSVFMTGPGESPCVSAHPSDPAPALLVYNARLRLLNQQGESEIDLRDFFALPEDDRRNFVTLEAGQLVTALVLPAPDASSRSVYLKAMPRASWAFALAGVAVNVRLEGDMLTEARVALSGVAPIPVRMAEAETFLAGTHVADLDYNLAADRLVAAAKPLAHNGYKVDLLRGIFKEALRTLLAGEG
ncbi:MAG TPA: FAD binding domain-containing protein [Chloroflexia bacterium]|nr:FAD binding domain-containing protein [Chloroflexia bacterium]